MVQSKKQDNARSHVNADNEVPSHQSEILSRSKISCKSALKLK